MICFPNAKINIGLNVIEKREDGYHNIESIFYPIHWCDALEVLPSEGSGKLDLAILGMPVPGSAESNLCTKVYNLLHEKYLLPSLKLWLLKCIPMGAGLGGGSSDAAFFLTLLNDFFKLNLSYDELKIYSSTIGSDCTFFLDNKPASITGKGDISMPIELDLSNYYISIVYPAIHVDTKNAYSLITPKKSSYSLKETILNLPVYKWKEKVINDFESPVFAAYPELANIKKMIYDKGALYVSMTGSGSALYGIFEEKPDLEDIFPEYKVWTASIKKAL